MTALMTCSQTADSPLSLRECQLLREYPPLDMEQGIFLHEEFVKILGERRHDTRSNEIVRCMRNHNFTRAFDLARGKRLMIG